MNFAWLADFLALAESGNFSRAAEERHVTQPAFSRRVRALEAWLGADLFDRSLQPAELTAAGRWFRVEAQSLLDRVGRLPVQARAVGQAHANTLRFAATHALSFTFLPGWLRGLESRLAVGPIQLVSDVLPRCEALLLERQVDFVLSHSHPAAPDMLREHGCPSSKVGSDALLAVCVPGPKGRARFGLDRENAMSTVPILRYSSESGLGRILVAVHATALERLGAEVVFTAHLASVLRTMALDGRGLAWLPRTLVAEDLKNGRLVEAAPSWRVEIDVRLYRDAARMGMAAEAFWTSASGAHP